MFCRGTINSDKLMICFFRLKVGNLYFFEHENSSLSYHNFEFNSILLIFCQWDRIYVCLRLDPFFYKIRSLSSFLLRRFSWLYLGLVWVSHLEPRQQQCPLEQFPSTLKQVGYYICLLELNLLHFSISCTYKYK